MKKFITALMCCSILLFSAVPAFAWTQQFYDDMSSGDLDSWEDSAGLSVNKDGYAVLGTFNKLLIPSNTIGAEDIRVSFDASAWGDNNLYMQFFNIDDPTDFFRAATRVPEGSEPFVEFTDWASSVKADKSGNDTWTRLYDVAARNSDNAYAEYAEFSIIGGVMTIKFRYTDGTEKSASTDPTNAKYGMIRQGVRYGVAFYSYAVDAGSTKIKNVKIETLDPFKPKLDTAEIDIQPGSKLNVKFTTDVSNTVTADNIKLLKADTTTVAASVEQVSDSEFNLVLDDSTWLTPGESLKLSVNGMTNTEGQKIDKYTADIKAKAYASDYTVGRPVLTDEAGKVLDKLENGKVNVKITMLPNNPSNASADMMIALCSGTADKYRVESVYYYNSVNAFDSRNADFEVKDGQFVKVMSFDSFANGVLASDSLIIGR